MNDAQGELVDLLSAWLPAQRWFAGGDAAAAEPRLTSRVVLAEGDPELWHLIVAVKPGRTALSYQVPVGLRSRAAPAPPWLGDADIGRLGDGRIAYDALRDPGLASLLLRGIASGRRDGPLRFAAEPGPPLPADLPGRVMSAEQSNTSIVYGEHSILKVLRRPSAGIHPDLEIPTALARRGSRLVAPPLGWIEMEPGEGESKSKSESQSEDKAGPKSAGGQPTVLAILSGFFPGASSAWDLATASAAGSQQDFTAQARTLGKTTAAMHAELAGAFGIRPLPHPELADLAVRMNRDLDTGLDEVLGLRPYEAGLRSCYAALAMQRGGELSAQRIHGDYHLGQVLATDRGWIVLDFEGEPSVPLDRRRDPALALRDVAGMLRSFDYAARQRPVAAGGWARDCAGAFCDGYASACGTDPRDSGELLRALIMQKAVYEAVYEARHRPDWLPIPLAAIAEGVL